MNPSNLLLSTSRRVNLYDDFFQSESPCKPVKKFTNVSQNTTQVVLSIIDNMLHKEGIFNNVLGEKRR